MPQPDKNPARLEAKVESNGQAVWRDVYRQGDPYYKDEDPITTATTETRPAPTMSELPATTTRECREVVTVQPMRRRYQRYYIEEFVAETRTSGWWYVGAALVVVGGVVCLTGVGTLVGGAAVKTGVGLLTAGSVVGGTGVAIAESNADAFTRGSPRCTGYFQERPIGEPERNGPPTVTAGPWHPC